MLRPSRLAFELAKSLAAKLRWLRQFPLPSSQEVLVTLSQIFTVSM
jgi:hypothetical protein